MSYDLRPILENIEIGRIDPPAFELRSAVSVDDLAESIREKGMLNPIIVRVRGDRFQLVAGHRRLLASKKLGLRRIQCNVVELDDKETFEVGITENVQRRSMDPIDEGRAFKRYVDEFGFGGMTELSKKIGKSLTYVSRRVALTNLPPEVQEKLLRRRNSSSLAIELLSLEEPDEMMEIAKQADSLNLSVRETRRLISKHARAPKPRSSTEEDRVRITIRAIDKSIIALKLALVRLDGAIESVQKDWFSKELLFQYRVSVHDHIDSLVHLKKKIYQRAQQGRRELPAPVGRKRPERRPPKQG
ncbi:MAG: ParB/RepB/Spo0J family partition protein [Thaumarchaeota archaeon]|nr:ParB/RepB/Spo0J family partition protein [Nitrososphaerota archaeon]